VHPHAHEFIALEIESPCFIVDGADSLARATGLTLVDIAGNHVRRAKYGAPTRYPARRFIR
jgi:hypothetical protein